MVATFRIDQTTPGAGISDRSRHDLIIGENVALVVTSPIGPGITYAWEIIDRVNTISGFVGGINTGASVALQSSAEAPFGFLVELRATLPGGAIERSRRIASARTPSLGLRVPLFPESADARSTTQSPLTASSVDNALYSDRAGTGNAEQNWRGWAEAFWELVKAVEGIAAGSVVSTDDVANTSLVAGVTATAALNDLKTDVDDLWTEVNAHDVILENKTGYKVSIHPAANITGLAIGTLHLFDFSAAAADHTAAFAGQTFAVGDYVGVGFLGDRNGFKITLSAGTDQIDGAATLELNDDKQIVHLRKAQSGTWRVVARNSASGGSSFDIGYSHGAPSANGIYGTFAEVYAAIQANGSGFTTVTVFDPVTTVETITGSFDLTRAKFIGDYKSSAGYPNPVLRFSGDFSTSKRLEFEYLNVENVGATPLITSANVNCRIICSFYSSLIQASAAPFADITNRSIYVDLYDSYLDGTIFFSSGTATCYLKVLSNEPGGAVFDNFDGNQIIIKYEDRSVGHNFFTTAVPQATNQVVSRQVRGPVIKAFDLDTIAVAGVVNNFGQTASAQNTWQNLDIVEFTGASPCDFTGAAASPIPRTVINRGSATIKYYNEHSLSFATLRLRTASGGTLSVLPGMATHWYYDPSLNRWKVTLLGGGAGGPSIYKAGSAAFNDVGYEVSLGGFILDASALSGTAYFKGALLYTSSDPASSIDLKLYDLGPGGAFAPVWRSTRTVSFANVGVEQIVEIALSAVPSPGINANEISNTLRVYEVRAIMTSAVAATATVSWSGVEVR